MEGIKVKIIEYIDGSQPGWVRCSFIDAFGVEWFIVEKVPVVTKEFLDEKSLYPKYGIVAGQIQNSYVDENNEEIITINTETPWDIEAENGEKIFKIKRDQVVNFD